MENGIFKWIFNSNVNSMVYPNFGYKASGTVDSKQNLTNKEAPHWLLPTSPPGKFC